MSTLEVLVATLVLAVSALATMAIMTMPVS